MFHLRYEIVLFDTLKLLSWSYVKVHVSRDQTVIVVALVANINVKQCPNCDIRSANSFALDNLYRAMSWFMSKETIW